MKRLITAAITLALLAAGSAASAGPLTRYTNPRFSYSIAYPADQLQALPVSENGDGRIFRARRGRAEARVWGGHNVLSHTPAHIAEELVANCIDRSSAYRRISHGLVTVSCLTVEGVFYQKTLVRGERMVSFSMIYAIDERRTWDLVAARMAASLNLH
jgi:hypothetical protein